jgi:hypothetical protein
MKGQGVIAIVISVMVVAFVLSFLGWWGCIMGNPSDSSTCNGLLWLWVGILLLDAFLGALGIRGFGK